MLLSGGVGGVDFSDLSQNDRPGGRCGLGALLPDISLPSASLPLIFSKAMVVAIQVVVVPGQSF